MKDDFYKDWKKQFQKNTDKRRRMHAQNNLRVPFNNGIEDQTYRGYIEYYGKYVDFQMRGNMLSIIRSIDITLYAFKIESKCRIEKMMRDYCS